MHQWKSEYEPGQSVYLKPNGNLLHCCFTKNRGFTSGGEGGRVEEFDWDGNLVWEFEYSSDQHLSHHDIAPLPNGNILMLVVEKKSYEECLAAGFNPEMLRDRQLFPDSVIEVQPTYPKGGKIVWEWHVWDHLIQDFDRTKANYGDVAAHPELIDVHCNGRPVPAFWNHMNSIAYNAKLDQIVLSVRGCNEIWFLDHSTTTKEAAGHTGGKHGKGGDLIYRWGNPAAYKRGTDARQATGPAARRPVDSRRLSRRRPHHDLQQRLRPRLVQHRGNRPAGGCQRPLHPRTRQSLRPGEAGLALRGEEPHRLLLLGDLRRASPAQRQHAHLRRRRSATCSRSRRPAKWSGNTSTRWSAAASSPRAKSPAKTCAAISGTPCSRSIATRPTIPAWPDAT